MKVRELKVALTVAGSDSGGGAGIQADLRAFNAMGVYGASAVTAVTAQNTRQVGCVFPLDAHLVCAQMEVVAADLKLAAVKTGLLPSAEVVRGVAAAIRRLDLPNLVVDPVTVASSGEPLAGEETVRALLSELLPRATVVTPNLGEAAALCGFPVRTTDEMRLAAKALHRAGARHVLLKGGHLPGDTCTDLLYDGERCREFAQPRVETPNTHGTGCTLAAAIAAQLARGADVREAVQLARGHLTRSLMQWQDLQLGSGPGPAAPL